MKDKIVNWCEDFADDIRMYWRLVSLITIGLLSIFVLMKLLNRI